VFSSIHKAKGLEATRAMILMPNLLPHPMVFKSNVVEVGLEQERNLAYVAVTRAMSELIIQPIKAMDLEDCPFTAVAEIGRTAMARRAAKGEDAVMYGMYLNSGSCSK
jgi:ATP-dependent exoDNAse (exonuclease V) alpha subunit